MGADGATASALGGVTGWSGVCVTRILISMEHDASSPMRALDLYDGGPYRQFGQFGANPQGWLAW